MQFPNPYEKPYYKFYILIALAILLVTIYLGQNVRMGIDLTGGTAMTTTVNKTVSYNELKTFILDQGVEDANIKLTTNPITNMHGVIIEFTGHKDIIAARELVKSEPERAKAFVSKFIGNDTGNLTASQYVQLADENFKLQLKNDLAAKLGVNPVDISVSSVGASIGKMFWDASLRAIVIACILIAAIVVLLFRQPVPSIAVLQAMAFDISASLAGMAVFGIPLTLPTIAALLMVVGYSVDSDIMVADRILKRSEGTTAERAFSALKTGLTMTGTVLAVLFVLVVFSYYWQMVTMFQLTAVLLFSLIGDIVSTYGANVVIAKWWADRKQ
jgi:preprotein translocase subunit SecF